MSTEKTEQPTDAATKPLKQLFPNVLEYPSAEMFAKQDATDASREAEEPFCGATCKDFGCTLPPGHRGWHAAHCAPTGPIVFAWSQYDEPADSTAALRREVEGLKAERDEADSMLDVAAQVARRSTLRADLATALAQLAIVTKERDEARKELHKVSEARARMVLYKLAHFCGECGHDTDEDDQCANCMKLASFENWLAELKAWQFATFPGETVSGVYEHLCEEVKELGADSTDELEIADCLMLLFCLAFHHNIDPLAALREKHKINLARKWKQVGGSAGGSEG